MALPSPLPFTAVPAEMAGRRELAELVPDHVLGNVNRHVRLAVVHADGVSDHRRDDRRSAAPRLDDAFFARLVELLDLLHEMVRNEGTLFETTTHYFDPRLRTIIFAVRLLRRVFLPIVIWPQGVVGGRPDVERASPPPCGWSTGFIAMPRTLGRLPMWRERPALPMTWFSCSTFPIWPIVARQVM